MDALAVDDPARALDELPRPRRVTAVGLLGEILATERALADFYRAFADAAELLGLRGGLAELARDKRRQTETLEPLLGPLAGAAAGAGVIAREADRLQVAPRAEAFLAAFQRERALEVLYREVGTLLAGSRLATAVGEAGARAAHHRRQLRELYLRYS